MVDNETEGSPDQTDGTGTNVTDNRDVTNHQRNDIDNSNNINSIQLEENNVSTVKVVDKTNQKILVMNIYKFFDHRKVRKLVEEWIKDIKEKSGETIEVERIKKPPKDTWAVITVTEESMGPILIDYINNNNIRNKKGNKVCARHADDEENGKSRKRQATEDLRDGQKKARRPVTDDEIRDAITPLWRLSPEEQLSSKLKDMIRNCAMKIVQESSKRIR